MIDLSQIKESYQFDPPRIVIYGPLKIGKSTLASRSEKPIFQPIEEGLTKIRCTPLPVAETFQDVLDGVQALCTQAHDYKTYVLDSIDWLEPLIWNQVCDDNDKSNIESFGYGKGYLFALDYWRQFLACMDALRAYKGMSIILIGHSQIKPYKNPETEIYDRYEIKLHKFASSLITEWCDAILLANYKVFTTQEKTGFNQTRTRAIQDNTRVLYCNEKPAYVAGNRYSMPDEIPMAWDAIKESIYHYPTPEGN